MTMTMKVTNGYAQAKPAATGFLSRGPSANAHHVAQQMCTLGMAANWFDTSFMPPELNDQNAGSFNSVSTKPSCGNIRGGASGYSEKPISAIAVAMPSALRKRG